jgi:uncharacterized membrane protein YidH (DUF202 family)
MILNLSSIYDVIRNSARADNDDDDQKKWKAPDSFVRKTTKYMVSPSNLVRVKTIIIKHLPVLVFNGDIDDLASLDARDSSTICSVYFDNRAHDSYHTRLDRLEGSTLIRVRWYESAGKQRELFVERKTHHDSWVSTKSIKERFSLSEQHATRYFTGRWSLESGANDATIVLARELQDEIVQREFRPALRTIYRRVAFQESHSNAVRISIDSEMSFVDERVLGRGRDAWQSTIDRVDAAHVSAFPRCILEIKLTTAEPIAWLDELLSSGLLQPVPKFSKFLHGTATLHRQYLNVLPTWWEELPKLPVVVWTTVDDEAFVPTTTSTTTTKTTTTTTSKTSKKKEKIVNDDNDDVRRITLPPSTTKQPINASAAAPAVVDDDDAHNVALLSSFRGNPPLRMPIKIEPKTFFANERTFLQWLNTLLLLAVGSSAFIAYGSEPFQVAGTLLVVISLVFVLYALAVYHWRRRAIVRRSVTRAYDDRFGPAALVTLVVLTFVLSVVLQFVVEPQSLVQTEALPLVK